MRSDRFVPDAPSAVPSIEWSRSRAASIRFPFWNGARIGLMLACGIFLIWLPIHREIPASRPAGHARGISSNPIRHLALSPDARTVATMDGRRLLELRQADGDPSLTLALDIRGYGNAVAFSPDSRFLAVGRVEPDVLLYQSTGREPGRMLGIPVRQTSALSFSPDGRLLAVSSFRSKDILVWDLEAARVRMTLRGHEHAVYRLDISPDGRSLASAASDERTILLWDLALGRPRHRLTGLPSSVLCLAYSPGGRWLASASAEKPVRIWDVESAREVRLIAGHGLSTCSLAFSPDGHLLATASGDGNASLWSVDDGREIRRLDAGADILTRIAFSRDGKTLAASGNDDDVRLWDVETLLTERAGHD